MDLLFGRSIPASLSRDFKDHAANDGHNVIYASMDQFISTEPFCELKDFKAGNPAIVFQSMAEAGGFSASDHFTHALLAGHTLKKYGAGPLWLVTPFGPFARQDQERDGKFDSLACEMAAETLSLYYNGVSTIEIHSEKAKALLEKSFGAGNVFSLDPTQTFADELLQQNMQQISVISPDKGANSRADDLANVLGASRYWIDKKRNVIETQITGSKGDVKGRDAVLVDDMFDTVGTADNGIRLVHAEGSASNRIRGAHPVLSGQGWDRLAKLIEDEIVDDIKFLNTIARAAERENFAQKYGPHITDKVEFINVGELLRDHVNNDIANHPNMQVGGP